MMATKLMHAALESRTYVLGPWNPSYRVTEILRRNLRELLPEDIHKICNGRLYISTTDIQTGANTALGTYTVIGHFTDTNGGFDLSSFQFDIAAPTP